MEKLKDNSVMKTDKLVSDWKDYELHIWNISPLSKKKLQSTFTLLNNESYIHVKVIPTTLVFDPRWRMLTGTSRWRNYEQEIALM